MSRLTYSRNMGEDEELTDMTESMHGAMSLDGDVDRLEKFYDGWAGDYDADVAEHGYGLPEMMARTVELAEWLLATSGCRRKCVCSTLGVEQVWSE